MALAIDQPQEDLKNNQQPAKLDPSLLKKYANIALAASLMTLVFGMARILTILLSRYHDAEVTEYAAKMYLDYHPVPNFMDFLHSGAIVSGETPIDQAARLQWAEIWAPLLGIVCAGLASSRVSLHGPYLVSCVASAFASLILAVADGPVMLRDCFLLMRLRTAENDFYTESWSNEVLLFVMVIFTALVLTAELVIILAATVVVLANIASLALMCQHYFSCAKKSKDGVTEQEIHQNDDKPIYAISYPALAQVLLVPHETH